MQDRTVSTITTLAGMLAEKTEKHEQSQKDLELCGKAANMMNDKIDRLEDQLSRAKRERDDARNALDEMHRETARRALDEAHRPNLIGPSLYELQSRANLLLAIFRKPAAFVDTMEWLGSEECRALHGQKIAQIKRVRNIGGWGLKEAKDLVEICAEFWIAPVSANDAPLVGQ